MSINLVLYFGTVPLGGKFRKRLLRGRRVFFSFAAANTAAMPGFFVIPTE